VGYEIYLRDGSRGDELWERVMEAGKPHELRPTGPSEFRRIEAGIFNYPSDINLATNPYEVGLDRLVDLQKSTDFVGKEALGKIKAEGAGRKLVGVEVGGPPIKYWLPEYWPVHADGKRIGHLTALAHSPRLQKNIGYAMVTVPHAKAGSRFSVKSPGGDRPATVVPLPFMDPRKEIPRT
jgi:aminomethyltransferase